MKLVAVQICSEPNIAHNVEKIKKQLANLIHRSEALGCPPQNHLVVLPECCLFFGGKDSEQLALAKKTQIGNRLVVQLAKLAKSFRVYLVAGTIPLVNEAGTKFTNTCCVFSPTGELLSSYDKIHLFDVTVADNQYHYSESRYTQAGEKLSVLKTEFAKIGLSVCFDLRFPLLYQELRAQGADIITVPSAFTRVTGEAHWQTLLQARAIENQVYIIAAGQEGLHANGRETWGHSMIISPWGEILACLPQGEGFISVDYQAKEIGRIRQNMPLTPRLNQT